jgi:hypothetical protein
LGVASGAAITRSLLHAVMWPRPATVSTNASRVEDLNRQLNLTPEQKLIVMQVLDDYAKYYENLEEDRQNVAEHGKRQILMILNPEQQKRFLQIYRSPSLPGSAGSSR